MTIPLSTVSALQRRYSEYRDRGASPPPINYRPTSSLPIPRPTPTLKQRASWCPLSPSLRARPEQLAAVDAVPLNALTLAGRQNDIISSVLGNRLRTEEELSPTEEEEDIFPSSVYSTSPSAQETAAMTPSGSVTNLLLCAPIYESPARRSTSVDLVSQNFGRARLNRVYHTRGSVDVLTAEPEVLEDGDGDTERPTTTITMTQSTSVSTKEKRRISTSWASVKESVCLTKMDFGAVLRRAKGSEVGEGLDWVRSCGEEVCGGDDEMEGKWRTKVFDKVRKGMKRHTVFWRG